MKSRKRDGGDMRRVLAGMVTDRTVCSRIAGRWEDGGLFDATWANLIGGWAVEHLQRYGEEIGQRMRAVYDEWAATTRVGDETVEAVERFLKFVSDERERERLPSCDHLLDVAGRLFNRVRLKKAWELAEDELDRGRVDEACRRMTDLGRVELGTGSLVKPAEDYDAWRGAFNKDRRKAMLSYRGKLDWFLGSAMLRENLVAFEGMDKIGKSFWLLDAAFRAVRARRRVAYFEAGDLTRDDVLERLGVRAARRPLKAGPLLIPASVSDGGKVESENRMFDGDLTPQEAYRAFRRACRGRDAFRLSCHPNSTLTVDDVAATLRDWEREGWTADVVVIDYADILAPPAGVRDVLDQIDAVWKQLRRLSQESHCLVVTATQPSAKAYDNKGKVLTRRHFGGRKTKLAHVNGLIGLNPGDPCGDVSVTRVNWIVRRGAEFRENRWVTVAGSLALAAPAMRCED